MLRKALLANGRGRAGYKLLQWQDKLFVGKNNLNSAQVNCPLATREHGQHLWLTGCCLTTFPALGLARLMEPVSWGCPLSVTPLWRHMAKWLLHLSQAYTHSYSWLHPDTFLASFTRGWGLRLNQGCVCWKTWFRIPSLHCLGSCFQLFYTDHSYVSWVFLLLGQVWFTTRTGLGLKRAYRPMQAEGRGPEVYYPFLGKHVPKSSLSAPQTALLGVVVFQASLTHLVAIVCKCLQEREHANNLCRKSCWSEGRKKVKK